MKLHFFMIKKIVKADSRQTCIAVISSDSAPKKDENYYPQFFLKQCEYTEKEKKSD